MNEFLILYILKKQPTSMYEIQQFINKHFNLYVKISVGTIAPVLKKLEAANLIEAEKKISNGGQRKHIFKITGEGQIIFHNLIVMPISGNPQSSQKEINILSLIITDSIFSNEEQKLLAKKIICALNNQLILIKNHIQAFNRDIEYLKICCEETEKKINYYKNTFIE
ncbi:MAG: PadR family transcriptional regulator [Candidatus Gastranaerophilales bacterium]|nr:PadR family transcriptional regulator [Candidatus Gastranaerophilales bacterium]